MTVPQLASLRLGEKILLPLSKSGVLRFLRDSRNKNVIPKAGNEGFSRQFEMTLATMTLYYQPNR
jgi:hypothetical protein